jgi:hypothetical protein
LEREVVSEVAATAVDRQWQRTFFLAEMSFWIVLISLALDAALKLTEGRSEA